MDSLIPNLRPAPPRHFLSPVPIIDESHEAHANTKERVAIGKMKKGRDITAFRNCLHLCSLPSLNTQDPKDYSVVKHSGCSSR